MDKEKENLDYLVADYLAEVREASSPAALLLTAHSQVTMGLLARRSRHSKDPKRSRPGFSAWFLAPHAARPLTLSAVDEIIPLVLEELLPKLVEYKIKLVVNAGGLDPVGLKTAIEALAVKQGLSSSVVVAAVHGDNIQSSYPALQKTEGAIKGFSPFGDTDGTRVEEKESVQAFLSVNAYVGAEGIAMALDRGATIVVTGRCVDSALTLGPCLHAL